MNTDLRTLVRASLEDLLAEHAYHRSEAAGLVLQGKLTAALYFSAEADKIAAEIKRRIRPVTESEPTVCSCPDMVLLPIGAYQTIELDGSHHGPETCEPCGVVAS